MLGFHGGSKLFISFPALILLPLLGPSETVFSLFESWLPPDFQKIIMSSSFSSTFSLWISKILQCVRKPNAQHK